MKTTYTPRVKESVGLAMTVEELILLRWCVNECAEREHQKSRISETMTKYDPNYRKNAKSCRRQARLMEKALKDMTVKIKV